jgi:hypothetical protein
MKNFRLFVESTFDELFDSAVRAFPKTRKRQHATDEVHVGQFRWTPFPGVKTFLLRATATNEDRTYSPMILFKRVQFREGPGRGVLKLKISSEETRYIEQLSPDNHDILVRCNCPDFYWRFNYYDHIDRSLYGNKRSKYDGAYPANPRKLPGMCKHLMKMVYTMQEVGLVRP